MANIVRLGIWLALASSILVGQNLSPPPHPVSIDLSPGVHIITCDSLSHRSPAHYEALCRIVLTEFGLSTDSICLTLVFVDDSLMELLNRYNTLRFSGTGWHGICINRYLVMVDGSREADDTFMHEYMHVLQQRGVLFTKVPASQVHGVIELNEGLLMGSRRYLNYLRSLPPEQDDDDEE